MNDPEAPMVYDREIGGAVMEERGQVKYRNRKAREKKQHREFAMVVIAEGRFHRSKQ
jgi:hypothetical protein